MIPLKYNVRNLRVRWVTTSLTVLATGLVVWSSCILFGWVEGLQHTLNVSGDPLDLIVLRKGSTNETNGGFSERQADDIANLPGIARGADGRPLVAKEFLYVALAERQDGSRANIIVRGVSPASRDLRPKFTIAPGGRDLQPGKGECLVSRGLARRFRNTALGGLLKVGEKESYRVVGLFTAGGSAAESEIWVDFQDLARDLNRDGFVSAVQLRAASPSDLERLRTTVNNDTQFKLAAQREGDYYATQSRETLFFKFAGTLIAVLLTFGAMFAAANTMYAAVSSRSREIGTMRALGFSRFDILLSFLGESVLLCSLGGTLGLLATIPLSYISVSTIVNFSETVIAFRLGPLVMTVALVMTLCMGVFGGLLPAIRAVRLDVVTALRQL